MSGTEASPATAARGRRWRRCSPGRRRRRPRASPPLQTEFANGATLRFYGQINKGILNYDDGIDNDSYYLIDNDNSSTRSACATPRSSATGPSRTSTSSSTRPTPPPTSTSSTTRPSSDDYEWSNANIRKIDFTLEHDRYGKFWLGQGSMATDGIAEIDLSGTDVIAYSGVGGLGRGADHPLQRPGRYSSPTTRRSATPTRTTTAAAWPASATTPRPSTASPSPSPTARTCSRATRTTATSTSTTSR